MQRIHATKAEDTTFELCQEEERKREKEKERERLSEIGTMKNGRHNGSKIYIQTLRSGLKNKARVEFLNQL